LHVNPSEQKILYAGSPFALSSCAKDAGIIMEVDIQKMHNRTKAGKYFPFNAKKQKAKPVTEMKREIGKRIKKYFLK